MTQVQVQGVWKDYGGVSVLENVRLEVASGSFVTLVGASGCGKSTFLRLLLGDERPSRGSIRVDGKPLLPEPGPDRGIVFQRYSVFPHLSVLGNVMLGPELQRSPLLGRLFGRARAEVRAKAQALLERVGLGSVGDALPSSLSGGMQQRLAVAQALILEPRILLLDEPFGALDPGIRADMQDLVLELWRDTHMTVFMVTHDLSEAFKLGTRVLTFDKVRHDPHDPGAFGANITYDLRGHNRLDEARA